MLDAAELAMTPEMVAKLRALLPQIAEEVVTAIIAEVPSYSDALSGRMGTNIRRAVQLALGTFLDLLSGSVDSEASLDAGSEAVYELGRGEARNGRSMDALLAAYRVGARVSWRSLSSAVVAAGIPATSMVQFAELVFAFIDEISATSAAGHADELATSGRVRDRYLAQLCRKLLEGADEDQLDASAEQADWPPPETLTAVVLQSAQAHTVRQLADARTLLLTEDIPDLPEDGVVLLIPDAGSRAALLALLRGTDAVIGPAKPWRQARGSYLRALRAITTLPHAHRPVDTELHLVDLVVTADPDAYADLRARVLAPLDSLRPATAARLAETLRSWLLHQGRRDEVAAELFVHPQTVRYRMGQLRALFGDALTDPHRVCELTVALAVEQP